MMYCCGPLCRSNRRRPLPRNNEHRPTETATAAAINPMASQSHALRFQPLFSAASVCSHTCCRPWVFTSTREWKSLGLVQRRRFDEQSLWPKAAIQFQPNYHCTKQLERCKGKNKASDYSKFLFIFVHPLSLTSLSLYLRGIKAEVPLLK